MVNQLKQENEAFRKFVKNVSYVEPEGLLSNDMRPSSRNTSMPSSLSGSYPRIEEISGRVREHPPPAKRMKVKGNEGSGSSGENSNLSSESGQSAGQRESSKTYSTKVNDMALILPGGSMSFISPMDVVFIQALNDSKQSYVITNPIMTDDPIIFCSEAFCELTKYTKEEVVGRNLRFLHGPDTDKDAVEEIKKQVASGNGVVTCIKNYSKVCYEIIICEYFISHLLFILICIIVRGRLLVLHVHIYTKGLEKQYYYEGRSVSYCREVTC